MKTIIIDGLEHMLTPILQEKNFRVDSSNWKMSPFDNRIKISPCGMASEILAGEYKGEQHFSFYYLQEYCLLDRVPTKGQLQEALDNGELQDIPLAGYRNYLTGAMYSIGSYAYLWSSSPSGSYARRLYIGASSSGWYANDRAYGFSVRLLAE